MRCEVKSEGHFIIDIISRALVRCCWAFMKCVAVSDWGQGHFYFLWSDTARNKLRTNWIIHKLPSVTVICCISSTNWNRIKLKFGHTQCGIPPDAALGNNVPHGSFSSHHGSGFRACLLAKELKKMCTNLEEIWCVAQIRIDASLHCNWPDTTNTSFIL